MSINRTFQPAFYHSFLIAPLLLALTFSFAVAQTYNEAPTLRTQVEAGQLPPVEERLPENPVVVEPVERIGDYGGTWRTALVGGADNAWMVRTIAYDYLVRWDPEWEEVIPNLAESFERNEEGTEYTFRLREGIKWSDGQPFTADDIMFWYEDVFLNDELMPVKPAWLAPGGEPVVIEKIDDYTVVFRFAEPQGLLLQQMASPNGAIFTFHPRHYFEQFHPRYNTENLDSLVQEAGLDNWVALFERRGGGADLGNRFRSSNLPTLNAWVITTAYGDGTQVVAERNPYYWKVDPEGNQLPYIDQVVYSLIDNSEVLVLRALSGEIDMMDRHLATVDNRAVFVDNMERGDYRLFETIPAYINTTLIALNLTHNDPVKREIFQNKDFRVGLSHAINRQEIIDAVYVSQGEPFQAGPRPGDPLYNEQLGKQYTEYDPDLANEYLDRAGYTERDAEGFRLGPDGQRIVIIVETTQSAAPGLEKPVDTLELVQQYWRDVGIDMQVRVQDRSLLDTRVQANEHDASVFYSDGGSSFDVIMAPFAYFPFGHWSLYAVLWRNWWTGAPNSEEPPAETRRQMELYDQLRATPDAAEQNELMREILEIAADQFYVLGINLQPMSYGVVKNNFRNVPEVMPLSYSYPSPAPTHPEQYFFDSSN